MLLLAASDAPDRRDESDPETPGSETSDSERRAPEHSAERESEGIHSAEVPPPSPASSSEVEPATPEAETAEPETAEPETAEPETAEPETAEPETAEPETAEPEAYEAMPPAPDIVPPEPLDRVPPSPPSEPARPAPDAIGSTKRSPLQRTVLALLFIAAAALIGYVLSRPADREADADALVRSIEAAGRLRLQLETDTPAEARRYVRDDFGWRVGVPVFEAVPLRGVAIAQIAPAVEVPVFLYADDEGRNVAVFAYNYALLDQVPDRLRLTDADYDELAEGTPFVRRVDGNGVLLWRDRDDIYVAVTDLPPEALIDGFAIAR
jgi:hypothetical protein